MKFKDFKVGDHIIWQYDGDPGIINEINLKTKEFRIHWYKSIYKCNYSWVGYTEANNEKIILDKSYIFNKDIENLLND